MFDTELVERIIACEEQIIRRYVGVGDRLGKQRNSFFFFFNDTATTEIYTLHIVGSVRCVQETAYMMCGLYQLQQEVYFQIQTLIPQQTVKLQNFIKKIEKNIQEELKKLWKTVLINNDNITFITFQIINQQMSIIILSIPLNYNIQQQKRKEKNCITQVFFIFQ
eukprot:TRINITY_DN5101_c0_g1_i2.p1 TRINITY_DN5101_c0_g1~~TRINITY_DN5101_c0_g1_i2.p1  ORF type:complete len:165 (-),score=29.57 TRINITY_DN5101_c0_g1_i2:149-643(-)